MFYFDFLILIANTPTTGYKCELYLAGLDVLVVNIVRKFRDIQADIHLYNYLYTHIDKITNVPTLKHFHTSNKTE